MRAPWLQGRPAAPLGRLARRAQDLSMADSAAPFLSPTCRALALYLYLCEDIARTQRRRFIAALAAAAAMLLANVAFIAGTQCVGWLR